MIFDTTWELFPRDRAVIRRETGSSPAFSGEITSSRHITPVARGKIVTVPHLKNLPYNLCCVACGYRAYQFTDLSLEFRAHLRRWLQTRDGGFFWVFYSALGVPRLTVPAWDIADNRN